MKRLLWLLLVLLCLSGCYPKTANVSQTEQPAPPVVAMSSQHAESRNNRAPFIYRTSSDGARSCRTCNDGTCSYRT